MKKLFTLLMLVGGMSTAFSASFVPQVVKTIDQTTVVYGKDVPDPTLDEGKPEKSWIVYANDKAGTSSRTYTSVKIDDAEGNPNKIEDNIPEAKDVTMVTIKPVTTYTNTGRVIHMRVKGVSGVIVHGTVTSLTNNDQQTGRGIAICVSEYNKDLKNLPDPSAQVLRKEKTGSVITEVSNLDSEKDYVVSIYGINGDTYFYCAELIYKEPVLNPAPIAWTATSVEYKVRDNVANVKLPELDNKEGLNVTYASSNENIATIDETGKVTLKNDVVGTSTISATYKADSKYGETVATYVITVKTNEVDAYAWAEFSPNTKFNFDYLWKAPSKEQKAGKLIEDKNLEVSTVYTAKATEDGGTFFGETFKNALQLGRIEIDPSTDNLTGTEYSGNSPMVVKPATDLQLVIIYKKQGVEVGEPKVTDDVENNVITNTHFAGSEMNDGKSLWAASQKNVTTKLSQKIINGGSYDPKVTVPGNEKEVMYVASVWDLKAGETYTIWSRGTTTAVNGIGYILPTIDAPTASVEGVADLTAGLDIKGKETVVKLNAAEEGHNVYAVFVAAETGTGVAPADAAATMTHDELEGQTFSLVGEDGVKVNAPGTLYFFSHDPASDLKSKLAQLTVKDSTTGVNGLEVDANAPVEYYNLNGVRVANPENGVFIRRQGNKVSKVVVK